MIIIWCAGSGGAAPPRFPGLRPRLLRPLRPGLRPNPGGRGRVRPELLGPPPGTQSSQCSLLHPPNYKVREGRKNLLFCLFSTPIFRIFLHKKTHFFLRRFGVDQFPETSTKLAFFYAFITQSQMP